MSPQARALVVGSTIALAGSVVALALLFSAFYYSAGLAHIVSTFAGTLVAALLARSHRILTAAGILAVACIAFLLTTATWNSYDPLHGNEGLTSAAITTRSFSPLLVVVGLVGALLGWGIGRYRNATPNNSLERMRDR